MGISGINDTYATMDMETTPSGTVQRAIVGSLIGLTFPPSQIGAFQAMIASPPPGKTPKQAVTDWFHTLPSTDPYRLTWDALAAHEAVGGHKVVSTQDDLLTAIQSLKV